MIKRPLNPRFSSAVLKGRKVTTIRERSWPIGKPIMLYNWSGLPYRSKQVDVAAIEVVAVYPVYLSLHGVNFSYVAPCNHGEDALPAELWETEGFGTMAEMSDWFTPLLKDGECSGKCLMRFRLLNVDVELPPNG
jgi:hypothetical protein